MHRTGQGYPQREIKIKIRRHQEFIDVISGTTYRIIRRLFGSTQRIKKRLGTTIIYDCALLAR
jgi:hypothetical protein